MPGSLRRIAILSILLTLAGCGSPSVEDYRDKSPAFIPEVFFNGPLTAHGVVKNRSGEVTRRFTATLNGSWKDGQGLLAEKFLFDDGEVQYRNWRLSPKDHTDAVRTYRGQAEDVIGEAELKVSGNAAFIRYTLEVPVDKRKIHVNVDDRMYLVSDRVLIGESKLTKWGFHVGDILLTIVHEDSTSE